MLICSPIYLLLFVVFVFRRLMIYLWDYDAVLFIFYYFVVNPHEFMIRRLSSPFDRKTRESINGRLATTNVFQCVFLISIFDISDIINIVALRTVFILLYIETVHC